MKTRKVLSIILVLAMLLSAVPIAFAADVPTITVETSTIMSGVTETNVSVNTSGFSTIPTTGLKLEFTLASGLTLESATLSATAKTAGLTADTSGLANGIVTLMSDSSHMATGVNIPDGVLLTLGIAVDSNAAGILNISLSDNQENYQYYSNPSQYVTGNIGNVAIENGSVVVNAATPTDGYTATIAGASANGNPVRVGEKLKVNIGTNKDFAATEMTITYPSGLVSFVAEENAAYKIEDDKNGTLKLVAYGDNKTAAADNYVLTFNTNAAGNAEFEITSAGFGTGDSAATANLTEATLPSALSITIAKKLYTVTLPSDIFAGADSVEEGEAYAFTPETSTGAYYDYSNVTATYTDGTTAVVTETDTGWKIENVTGNLTISGTRTPKEYDVTWSGEGADDMEENSKVSKATYGTNFVFTIPDDIPKTETTDGVTYSATITIGGKAYSPTVSGKTYTITGTSIIGAVAITVNETVEEADKVTVKVEGSTDITINDVSASSGPVNVEKEKDVTVQVNPEAGYDYVVKVDDKEVELDNENKHTIEGGLTADTTIEVTKTVKVADVTKVTGEGNVNGAGENFVTADKKEMYLIKMPDHINMQEESASKDKAYTYDGKQMYWSDIYETYVITVFCEEGEEPSITHDKFAIIDVDATPEIKVSYDVNQSGVVDANDAQLIWNMYQAWYSDFETVSEVKFILADANGDEVLDMRDAVVIINDILKITANETT